MASDHDHPDDAAPEPDERLMEVLDAYLQAVESGQSLDRTEWLAQYPDLALELTRFLDEQDRLMRLTEPLRPIAEAASLTGFLPDDTLDVDGDGTRRAPSRNRPESSQIREFGDYDLIEPIAHGGMGTVFKARHRSLNRLVALKMVRGGALAAGEDLQRFRQEAEAVAHLDHPCIVPIYDVGEHDGLTYFSMKLADGGSVAQRIADYPANPRLAAKLLAAVARAVHHAHQRGILHRDLKPSNILLDEQGQPYVSDFGLAKRLEDQSELTQSGTIVGTPSYMAPEQASGKRGGVTTAADVYGLGAVLYATLTGRPPFQGDSALQTIENVKEREPDPPSGINRRVDRDLETICLKCLEKEPERRYASALALAEDLERWLVGEPIAARAVGRPERVRRWCRRNPVVAALSASLAVLVATAVFGLAVSRAMIASRARAAEQQRDEARHRLAQACQVVDTMYTDMAEQWLEQQPRLEPLQRKYVEAALSFYQELAAERGADTTVRQRVARAYYRVGRIQHKLGRLPEAEAAFSRATDLGEELVSAFPHNVTYRAAAIVAYRSLGDVRFARRRLPDAERAYRRGIALSQESPAETPPSPVLRQEHAMTLFALADQIGRLGRTMDQETEGYLRRGIGLMEPIVAVSPDSVDSRASLAWGLYYLERFLRWRGHLVESKPLIRTAIQHMDAALTLSPGDPRIGHGLSRFHYESAALFTWLGQCDEAAEGYQRAIDILDRLASDFPRVPQYRQERAWVRAFQADLLYQSGRGLTAEPILRESAAVLEQMGSESPDYAESQFDLTVVYLFLSNLLYDSGRPREAEQICRTNLALLEALRGRSSELDKTRTDAAATRHNLAKILCDRGELAEARGLIERAIRDQQVAVSADPNGTYACAFLRNHYELLGRIAVISGQAAESISAYRRAAEVGETLAADQHAVPAFRIALITIYDGLGRVLAQSDCLSEAEQVFQKALAITEALTKEFPGRGECWGALARTLVGCRVARLRDLERAVLAARRAVALSPGSCAFQRVLGVASYRTGNWKAAAEALEISVNPQIGADASGKFFLAMARWRMGDRHQARQWYDRAVAWMDENKPKDEDLSRLCSEANTLLGLAAPEMPDGPEAFAK